MRPEPRSDPDYGLLKSHTSSVTHVLAWSRSLLHHPCHVPGMKVTPTVRTLGIEGLYSPSPGEQGAQSSAALCGSDTADQPQQRPEEIRLIQKPNTYRRSTAQEILASIFRNSFQSFNHFKEHR